MSDSKARRFWPKVEKQPDGGCWLWTAALDPGGYGRFKVGRTSRLAHRVAYELVVGPIPGGLTLDHLCKVTACVNPEHLEPVDAGENVRRGFHRNSKKTHCPWGHPYDEANTYVVPDTQRRACRKCRSEAQIRRTAARRAAALNHAKDSR